MSDFRMGAKVTIISSKKTDGRYNHGIVVGIDKHYPYLGFTSEKQFFSGFKVARYKVAYVDCFTHKACQEWVTPGELVKYSKDL